MATATSPEDGEHTSNDTQRSMLASQRANKQSQTARNAQASKKPGLFPMSFAEGFSQWWSSVPAATAEHRVLSLIPYLKEAPTHTQTASSPPSPEDPTPAVNEDSSRAAPPVLTDAEDPYGPRRWSSNLVKLSGKNRFLNEFSVERIGEPVEENLVLLHGYGAGLGFFYKNFESLSRPHGWRLYALDMLGMGRSSRPTFKIHARDPKGKVTEAENWFIDALEEWRQQKKIERFTLLGHSLGGYMAVAYALKYPGHLKKLILASPVGIPEDPYAVNADMPQADEIEADAAELESEFLQHQEEEIAPAQNGNNLPTSTSKNQGRDHSDAKKVEAPRRPYSKLLTFLWDANVSVFSLVRWTGPLGPRLVSGWSSRRFSHLPPEEAQILHTYVYSLFTLRGSGEYVLPYVLAPGAFARSPLIRRIHRLGRQWIPPPNMTNSDTASSAERVRENGLPVVFLYGSHDWMDVNGGYAAEKKMNEERERILKNATEEQRRKDRGSAKVMIVDKAGHHLYLDAPETFNKIMLEEMEDVQRSEKELDS